MFWVVGGGGWRGIFLKWWYFWGQRYLTFELLVQQPREPLLFVQRQRNLLLCFVCVRPFVIFIFCVLETKDYSNEGVWSPDNHPNTCLLLGFNLFVQQWRADVLCNHKTLLIYIYTYFFVGEGGVSKQSSLFLQPSGEFWDLIFY